MNKNVKKYLCIEGGKDFLIEAEDIKEAEGVAKQWNMVVKAIWYEQPKKEKVAEWKVGLE